MVFYFKNSQFFFFNFLINFSLTILLGTGILLTVTIIYGYFEMLDKEKEGGAMGMGF